MTYKVESTQSFDKDLEGMTAFYAEILGLPNAAIHLVNEVREAEKLLSEFPCINPLIDMGKERSGFRRHLLKRYLVIYRVMDEKVVFYRLFHQSQNYESYLFG